jgi:ADP-glucose pyrophosphorylase
MIYTRVQFGNELKEKALNKQNVAEIGAWAFSMYWKYIDDIDSDFKDILLALNGMEFGPEFAFTYERLNEIADALIAGNDVSLDY